MTPLLRPALALALLLAAPPAMAQGTAPDPSPAAAPEPDAPDDPAEAAPRPADLLAPPRPALPAEVANLALAPDIARLPIGGWRLGGRAGRGEPDHGERLAIETIGRLLAFQTTGRVTILAQAAGPAEDPSANRRTSLARAITVKASLMRGGLAGTRIDIRPLGRTAEALDVIDIVAPPAQRRRDAAATPAPAVPSAPRGG